LPLPTLLRLSSSQEHFGLSKQTWEAAIQRPLLMRDEFGRRQLLRLLRRIMMRASKEDLLALPPCSRQVTTLNFAAEHAASYNQLTETIRRNFLLAGACATVVVNTPQKQTSSNASLAESANNLGFRVCKTLNHKP
jgi:hypothetical protein